MTFGLHSILNLLTIASFRIGVPSILFEAVKLMKLCTSLLETLSLLSKWQKEVSKCHGFWGRSGAVLNPLLSPNLRLVFCGLRVKWVLEQLSEHTGHEGYIIHSVLEQI